ncbi:MAG TPA: stage 0 sporulation family protein [Candidatus Enterenecus merdae]|nr:stage 0 sporulation family protein [Candidatus Enterenecus merdae]
MTEIIGVRFKAGGKQYYFDPMGLRVGNGQSVIVETGKGLEYGTCVRPNGFVNDEAVMQPLRPVVRLATQQDERQIAENRRKEKEALGICQKLIERHGLEMKLVQAEYSFDGSKIIFFFTAEGRVDFRALVKDLAGRFRTRIELRQIGVRDEARMLGGLGICGKPFCCAQFLDEFQPVSIKMAKVQNLSLNPTKISGTCGRLMCCLKYEQNAYEDAVKRCPKQESFVECPDGVGNVVSVDLLKERVKVRLEDSSEQPKSYRVSEIRVVRNGKGKRPEDYVAPPKAELEKLRYIPPEGEGQAALGGARNLSELLDQYLDQQGGQGASSQAGGSRSGSRRRRGGKREGQGQQQSGNATQAQPKQRQAPSKTDKTQAQAAPAEGAPSGERKRRRHRPHHRKPKPPAGGEQGNS